LALEIHIKKFEAENIVIVIFILQCAEKLMKIFFLCY
jgi:hypothetical protein